ncbi:helix-turn-helix domain-containing protein [Methanococcoides methylutens]|uniref:winged helix-turn-helix transcriptional regulator n=1 Tax=Methanococcoides methylutens TaxID=2226 RepID=UPI00069743CC|nr:helix-turn-helix domain-containing protein [Methanococcoides methylutens]
MVTESLEVKLTMDGYMELSKKWAIFLIKDMFFGCKRFNDFLQVHDNLSNRVLSDQLKGLEKHGFIKKEIVSTTPIRVEYSLTELGRGLNKMLYEKVMFAIKFGLADRNDSYFRGKDIEKAFGIKK